METKVAKAAKECFEQPESLKDSWIPYVSEIPASCESLTGAARRGGISVVLQITTIHDRFGGRPSEAFKDIQSYGKLMEFFC